MLFFTNDPSRLALELYEVSPFTTDMADDFGRYLLRQPDSEKFLNVTLADLRALLMSLVTEAGELKENL
ncbi:hypothetical protein [Vibrio mediterranei]|uniref:hypothetical protein n=1 Tax=Vibrio mediterranei TaxID=689 RepID=UPI00406773D5